MRLYRLGFLPYQKVWFPLHWSSSELIGVQGDRKYDKDLTFRKFKRQLYHDSIAAILNPLKPGMEHPVIRRCPDGHYRRVIFDLAAYIADYPEQVYLSGIVQNWCPKYIISFTFKAALILETYRCKAADTDLDKPAGRRSQKETRQLKEVIKSQRLWDEFGIDDDITVRQQQL